MARSTHIQQILDRLPHQPGVYQHFDALGKLLYVGKAKDLKKRVTSYFTKQQHENGKTRLLVSKIADVQWLITPTEADALLLENSLIKEHKPIYNIQLKDDKYITNYYSTFGENIQLEEPVLIHGKNVEVWMSKFEDQMFKTMRAYLDRCLQDSTRPPRSC